jgi:hypothetical protein
MRKVEAPQSTPKPMSFSMALRCSVETIPPDGSKRSRKGKGYPSLEKKSTSLISSTVIHP